MKNKQDLQFIDKVIDALRKTAVNLEELQVKAALGKADAKDKYEEIKKDFNLFIHESEFKIKGVKQNMEELKTKFEELRVQLALGKADTIDVFKKQKKQLLTTLHEIEVKIKSNETLNRMYAVSLIEIEQFKIQLEILEQKYKQDKKETKSSFEKGKDEFNAFIDKFKEKYGKKKEETKFEHFQNEISEAFTHFKNAFSKT
jgi:predicted  nucleic acid-binding Zn-ribbon protein